MRSTVIQKGRATPALGATRILAAFVAILMLLPCMVACNLFDKTETTPEQTTQDPQGQQPQHEHIDYVSQTKLDMASTSLKIEATVKSYIDGDTTHFYVTPSPDFPEGVIKARYLAIDTPESTGRIEAWGKTAANHTKEMLRNAYAILLESDTETWNVDNNGRHLLWVWYKTDENSEWRNLNLEILQSGYAYASNSGQNRYGTTCMAALNQAMAEKLYVHSDQKDPAYPYDAAVMVSVKELRTNPADYEGTKVAIEGIVAQDTNGTLYIEQYDEEDEKYYGVSVYYGYNLATQATRFLKAGNLVYLVGIFQYATAVEAYQIGGLEYDRMKPGDPAFTHLIEAGQTVAYTLTDVATLRSGETQITSPDGDVTITFRGNYSALHTSVSLEGLTVVSTYTTDNEDSKNNGAISLTCEKDGVTITIRTIVLYEDGKIVTADRFEGKVIDVKGIVDSYTPEGKTQADIQVKVFSLDNITIH